MIVATPAIVLRATKFGDTSLIVNTYTRLQGHQSFMVKNAFSKKSRFNVAHFEPLSVLDITYNDNNKDSLKYFKDLSVGSIRAGTLFDPSRNAILFFYNEILFKLLTDFGPDSDLFDFLVSEIEAVGSLPANRLANLPLDFILRLSDRLGYAPSNNYSLTNRYFQMQEARFVDYFLSDELMMSGEESSYLHLLLSGTEPPFIPYSVRIPILRKLVVYLQLNNEHVKRIDSIDILSSILR